MVKSIMNLHDLNLTALREKSDSATLTESTRHIYFQAHYSCCRHFPADLASSQKMIGTYLLQNGGLVKVPGRLGLLLLLRGEQFVVLGHLGEVGAAEAPLVILLPLLHPCPRFPALSCVEQLSIYNRNYFDLKEILTRQLIS